MQDTPSYNVSIHLGASSLSLLICETVQDEVREIEYLEQPVPLARDIFRNKSVKRQTLERIVDIVKGYVSIIEGFGLDIHACTTPAVTNILIEAKNRQSVLNRLKVSSGLEFLALDNGAMTRLVFKKIKRRQEEAAFINTGKTLAIHVGPGNTRTLLLNNGRVERYNSYRLGTHRTSEALRKSFSNGKEYLQFIRSHTDPQLTTIKYDHRRDRIDNIILIGYEIQLVSDDLGTETYFRDDIQKYGDFLDSASSLTEEERINRFNLDVHTEDAFLPALQINYNLLHSFKIQRYWIPKTDFEKGLLRDLAASNTTSRDLEPETIHAAKLFALRYNADPTHYMHVCDLATKLFEDTQKIHELKDWDLLLLKVAAIAHKVGTYISPRLHHKHSYYLIANSEIFGLNERYLKIVALIARYHRKSPPKLTHSEYMSLPKEDQLLVCKLSALLRIADALDVAQQQRVKSIITQTKKNKFIITALGLSEIELELERIALKEKGDLFEELFGLDLLLK